jgi:hypothetical protein
MNARRKRLGLLLAGSLLLAGCSSSHASIDVPANQRPSATPAPTAPTSTPAPSPVRALVSRPSAAARMVCAQEARRDIETVLAIKQIPVGRATFANHLYTCTYRLPTGALTLSVKDTLNRAGTDAYFATLRQRLGSTRDLDLGEASYGTDGGTVVLRKDNDVLQVDATGLPALFGSKHQKRSDVAYEVALVILGCWTGT